jgi:Gpi18-like mannosyltransferase
LTFPETFITLKEIDSREWWVPVERLQELKNRFRIREKTCLVIIGLLIILFTLGNAHAQSDIRLHYENGSTTGFPGNQLPFYQIIVATYDNQTITSKTYINGESVTIETKAQPSYFPNGSVSSTMITTNIYGPDGSLKNSLKNTYPCYSLTLKVSLTLYNNTVTQSAGPLSGMEQSVKDYLIIDNSPGNSVLIISSIFILTGLILLAIKLWDDKNRRDQAKLTKKARKLIQKQPEKTETRQETPDTRKIIGYTIGLFILTRIVLTVTGIISIIYVNHSSINGLSDIISIWTQYDGNFYMFISQYGYMAPASLLPATYTNIFLYAWFPLYPLMIHALSIVIPTQISGLLISNACLFVCCYYLFKLVTLDNDTSTGLRAIKYMIIFPTAFVFSALMSESLFVMLALMSFYYARKNQWYIAGCAGFFASLARPVGVYLLLPLAFIYIDSRGYKLERIKADILGLLGPVLGFFTYMVYCYLTIGFWTPFIFNESTFGNAVIPVFQLFKTLTNFDGGYNGNPWLTFIFINAIFTLLTLTTLIVFHKKIDTPMLMYGLLMIFVPLSSPGSIVGMTRYISIVFPLFIIAAKLGADRRTDLILTSLFIVLQIIIMLLWAASIPIMY